MINSMLLVPLWLALALAGPAPERPVAVAAASDLKFAMDELVAEFGRAHPDIKVVVTYGSSGNFHAQIANGAPFDAFFSADAQYPRLLAEAGLADKGSVFLYAIGRIVLWVPKTSSIAVERGLSVLADRSVRHVAIANPKHAPYGRAAEAALRAAGVYDAVQSKLVFGENIAQTAQF